MDNARPGHVSGTFVMASGLTNTKTNGASESTQSESVRLDLISELFQTAANSAFGMHQIDETRVAQLLGESVKSRLFTAEESYRLKDKILDSSHLDRAIDRRIEITLRHMAA